MIRTAPSLCLLFAVLIADATAVLAAEPKAASEPKAAVPKSKTGTQRLTLEGSPALTCVNVRRNLRSCFANDAQYAKWKACVKRGSDPGKCYITITRPGEGPGYPATLHFQFDYVVRDLTDQQVQQMVEGDLSPQSLIDGPLCRFQSGDVSGPRPELEMRPHGNNIFDLNFDVRGESSTNCSSEKIVSFLGEFRRMPVLGGGLPGLGEPFPPVTVTATGAVYELDHSYHRYVSFDSYDSATETATGSFEFIAKLKGGTSWLIAVNGHFKLRNEARTYPQDLHFQFDYIIRELTSDQVQQINSHMTSLFDVIDGPMCQFVGESFGRVHPDLNVFNQVGDHYDLKFDIDEGSSPNCSNQADEVVTFLAEFADVTLGAGRQWDRLRTGSGVVTPRAIDAGNTSYHLQDQRERISLDSLETPPTAGAKPSATGAFEFVAHDSSHDKWLIAVFGHYKLEDEVP